MMNSVLQFAAILSLSWLIQGVVAHANHDEDKSLNNKNKNGPTAGDFYFDDQKASDNVKTGRIITQSAWSKEDEEILPDENKTGVLSNDEFSLKNALSYILSMIHELKKDIFGIKEMASLKNTKEWSNSQDNSENKVKQKKMGEKKVTLKADTKIPDMTSTKNTEFEKKNRPSKSNYIVDYYKSNDIKFVDEDLETSGDESDDSSHNLDGETVHETIKNKDDPCIYKCLKIKGNSDRYSSETEVTTNIPMSKTEIIDESDKEFDDDDSKESITRSSKMKQNKAKTSEETKNISNLRSKLRECIEDNNSDDDSNKLNRENEPSENILESTEYVTRDSQDENFDGEKSKKSNPNKTTDYLSKRTSSSDHSKSGKNSINKSGSDLDDESDISEQSTTLSFQSSKDGVYSENIEKEPIPAEKPASKTQQEETISFNPEDQKQSQNNDITNEHPTVALKPNEDGNEIPDLEISTDAQFEDRPKESKRNQKDSSHSTTTYSREESGSKKDEQQTHKSFDADNPVSPTSSENVTKSYILNKDSSDNLNDKDETNANINAINKDSETQSYNETGQTITQQLNNDSERRKSFRNGKLKDKNRENSYKKEDDNTASMTTNNLPSLRHSNLEIQNYDIKGSRKPEEEQKNKDTLNKGDARSPASPDYEHKGNGLADGDLNQNQKGRIATKDINEENNGDISVGNAATVLTNESQISQRAAYQKGRLATNDINEENNGDISVGNAATVLTNESQISQLTDYAMEEKSPEQYNTFLEYFYKHSNSPLINSLRNQSLFS